MNQHDPYAALTRAAINTQLAHSARAAAEQQADAHAATRLAAAETTLANQRDWAAEQLGITAGVVAEGATRTPREVATAAYAPAPPPSLLPDTGAGLEAAAGHARAALDGIQAGGRSLLLWQTRRSSIMGGIVIAALVILGLVGLFVSRAVAQQQANVTATAQAISAEGTARAEGTATQTAATATQAMVIAVSTADEATRRAEGTAQAVAATEEAVAQSTAVVEAQQATATAAYLTQTAPTPAPPAGALRHHPIPDGRSWAQVYVPAGSFMMGSAPGDPEAQSDEFPRRQVSLDAYWIDATEVTNGQFAAFLSANGNQTEGGVTWLDINDAYTLIETSGGQYTPKGGFTNHPVINVSWFGAQNYCQWAGGRLPTEAEWEYAARGPQSSFYPWGDNFACHLANLDDETRRDRTVGSWGAGCDGYDMTAPVGNFPGGASWVGALDMAGNVYEWVADWYDPNGYGGDPVHNPTGPAFGDERGLRGSAWNMEESEAVRSASRLGDVPGNRRDFVGFRCVIPDP